MIVEKKYGIIYGVEVILRTTACFEVPCSKCGKPEAKLDAVETDKLMDNVFRIFSKSLLQERNFIRERHDLKI